jgi:hypothetical protein
MTETVSEHSPRRMRRSRDEWQRLIDEQAASGQTQTAFCAERGISVGSFSQWKRRLAEEPGSPAWIDLSGLPTASSTRWEIELDLGDGLCLRLRRC